VPEVVLNNLFKLTQLQTTFGIILLGVLDNQPRIFNLKQLLETFVDHRKEVVVRRTEFDLARARERAHILEGLVVALDHLDEVIALIRSAADPASAKAGLMDDFSLSERQAQAILDMRLQRLTGLERDKIIDEYAELKKTIAHLEAVLGSEEMVADIVIDELEQIKSTYGEARRTEIIADVSDLTVEDLIAEEDMAITVSRGGYIKRSAASVYRAQRRGGRGRRGMATKAEDEVWKVFVASTHATMLFFTTSGRVFARKVHELPDVGPAAKGRALVNLLQLDADERITALLAIRDFDDHPDSFLLFATRKGKVKRTELEAYANIRANGLRAIVINDGDDLLSVQLTDGHRHVFIGTHHGMGIRFPETDVRPMGRVSAGVMGIKLRTGDYVEELATVDPEEENDILVVTDLGFGKRTAVSEFRIQKRGGIGVTLVKLTGKNGNVVGIHHVDEDDQLLMVTEGGMIIRMNVDEIRRIGRATQGVRLIRLDDDDRVVSVAITVAADDDELAGGDAEADSDTTDDDDRVDPNGNDVG
jgi:DNA gyrase subunit A